MEAMRDEENYVYSFSKRVKRVTAQRPTENQSAMPLKNVLFVLMTVM